MMHSIRTPRPGTNRLVFRGRIPAAGAAGDHIAGADATYAMATDGTAAAASGSAQGSRGWAGQTAQAAAAAAEAAAEAAGGG